MTPKEIIKEIHVAQIAASDSEIIEWEKAGCSIHLDELWTH